MTTDLQLCYEQLGFAEPPFRITPDTDYFFPSQHHQEALDHLTFGVASGGLTMLTGEVGVGKTLLCRYLLRNPPEGVRFAYLLNPDQSYADLLASIYQDLTGEVPEDGTIGGLQRALPDVLLRLASSIAVVVESGYRKRKIDVFAVCGPTRTRTDLSESVAPSPVPTHQCPISAETV